MKIKVYEVYKRDFEVFNYNFSNNNAWWLDGFTNMDLWFTYLTQYYTQ